jgi:hypothetical protein
VHQIIETKGMEVEDKKDIKALQNKRAVVIYNQLLAFQK